MQAMHDTISQLRLSAYAPDVMVEIPRNACGFFEFWRAELLEHNPLVWLVVVNGMLVDARSLPPELQAEAHRRGLIPQPRPAEAA